MNLRRSLYAGLIAAFVLTIAACSSTPATAPDITASVKDAMKAAGLNDVSVSQDREKGVVTLKGSVTNEADKSKAESLTKALAGTQVVGNEIAVLPVGGESAAKAVSSDLDDGIKANLDATLLQNKLDKTVKYDVKLGVVTLNGEVVSQGLRAEAERLAMAVPNVKQVVNKLDVKSQKATSTKAGE